MRMFRIIIFFMMFLAVSCMKEDIREPYVVSEEVKVALEMSVAGELPRTKEIIDPDITDATVVQDVIKNFWILQYDGTADGSLLVGEPEYYPDMDKFLNPESEGGDGGKVRLVRSAGNNKNRIVILANTFDPLMTFPKDSDFGDLKKQGRYVNDAEGHLSSSGGDKYIQFNGTTEVSVNESSQIRCYLKRNVARISITIRNSSEDVTVNSWQIRSVPSVSYYFNDYALPETFPALVDFKAIDYPVHTPATPLAPGSGDAEPYVVYVPVNKRGTDARVASEQKKNEYAMTGATFLQVNASYGEGVPIQYTFYLGENMTTDFNILPNKAYSYVFDISAQGSSSTDSRVKELGLVDFTKTEVANCYVLNPAQTAGVRREFRIPVSRVDEFWGGNGYENVPNYTLGSSKSWEVKIISANFDNSGNKVRLEKSTGTGSQDYFSVTVAPDLVDDRTVGSVIVALYVGDDQACWSWHLWVTDYAPEEAFLKTPEKTTYSYAVPGGAVHRYSGSLWTSDTGKYRNSFMMDRYLGAFDSFSYTGKGTGSMYYQFGRKDPFFGLDSYTFGKKWVLQSYEGIRDGAPGDPEASVKYAIHNPLTFITTSERVAWTVGTKYNPSTFDGNIKWQDPYTSLQYVSSAGGSAQLREKSIFDPCPAGYKVPDSDIWGDFRRQTDARPTTNVSVGSEMKRGFPLFSSVNKGMYYWPYSETGGVMDKAPEYAVYYPALGVIQQNGTSTYNPGRDVYVAAADPYRIDKPYYPHANDAGTLGKNTGLGRSHASPVRCITIQ